MKTVSTKWGDFKTIVDSKKLRIQYIENTNRSRYEIWAQDGFVLYECEVSILNPAPIGSDQEDFEDNYKLIANALSDKPRHTTTIQHGQTTITTAGTAVILMNGATETQTITIKSVYTNTGNVYVGNLAVDSSNGFILEPGSSLSIDHDHSQENLYVDAANNGDKICYFTGRN